MRLLTNRLVAPEECIMCRVMFDKWAGTAPQKVPKLFDKGAQKNKCLTPRNSISQTFAI